MNALERLLCKLYDYEEARKYNDTITGRFVRSGPFGRGLMVATWLFLAWITLAWLGVGDGFFLWND